MFPYWLLFGFFAFGSLFARPDAQLNRKLVSLVVAWLVLTLMIGLRWEIGPDWISYSGWWDRAGNWPLARLLRLTEGDPVFYAVLWLIRQTGVPFWVFGLLMAAVFATGLVGFARLQANPWLAIAVAVPYLVIVVAMSGVRQATAIGFVFMALRAFHRERGRGFLIYMALAASFHASAILVFPLAGLSFARNRFQSIVLIMLAAFAGYYLLNSTFDIYSERYFSRTVQSSGTLFRIGMSVVPAALYLLFRNRFQDSPRDRSLWRNFSIAAVLTLPLYFIVPSTTALDRLVLYLFPLQIHVLACVPSIQGGRGRNLIVLAILAYLGAQQFAFFSYGLNRDPYVPYRTIFSSQAE
jgi:hypothetical protein